ncbi:MAG TPA: DEAD/DEAH box helicase, partial [Flavitalea sp.]|nr:DEAD/DEAH box helicase [Flavitalea sp.]
MENKSADLTLLYASEGYRVVKKWLASRHFHPFMFQEEAWSHIIHRRSGLVNAPTGCGKTYSVFLGAIIDFINSNGVDYAKKQRNGLQLIWVTPLRALAKDIGRAMEEVIEGLGMQWKVGLRNGDTPVSERQKQKRQMPEVLIITPESMHLLLAQRGYKEFFSKLRIIAVDEWHELLGSKRGVQVELAISRILGVSKGITAPSVWGISATIGNLDQAREVLLAPLINSNQILTGELVRAEVYKPIDIQSVFPDEIEKYPWAGHLGIRLIDKVIPIINSSRTTLIFINTRGMSERWYQMLLDAAPDLAGAIALHHGSIDMEMRTWVEESLHSGILKVVVCTSSLDLGVDFRPVETVIQVGSPKGVARFLQRAGRSGHQPGEVSKIYFLPTHSLELVEAAALKAAKDINFIESREPRVLCFDVLIQYLCTLAVSEGFRPDEILPEVRSTYCYNDITDSEWEQMLYFITSGGSALQQYDEFKKVEIIDDVYRINNRRIAMRHRMHIGTIVSDPMLKVKFFTGGYIGMIEEYFISRLSQGDVFTLAGRTLEFIMIKEMTVLVKKSQSKKSIVPSWNGGRLPLSANLGIMLRKKFNEAFAIIEHSNPPETDIELKVLEPLFALQQRLSH